MDGSVLPIRWARFPQFSYSSRPHSLQAEALRQKTLKRGDELLTSTLTLGEEGWGGNLFSAPLKPLCYNP